MQRNSYTRSFGLILATLVGVGIVVTLLFADGSDGNRGRARHALERMRQGDSLSLEDKSLIEEYFPSPSQNPEEQSRNSLDDNGGTFFIYAGPSRWIPPTGTGGSATDTTVTQVNVTGLTGQIADVQFKIDSVRHTWDSDLTFTLVSPLGTTCGLINRRGGSADNFVRTVLSDSAPNPVATALAPFTGSFRPEQALAVFDGESPNGLWTLIIHDNASGDSGKVVGWRVQILTGPPPPCYDFTVTAPGSFAGNTMGTGNNCNYRPSEDQIWRINIPQPGEWTFSLCDTTPSFDPYLYLGLACCDSVIAFDDDACGSYFRPVIPCQPLEAGQYFLTVESFYADSSGSYTLNISPCTHDCFPPQGLVIIPLGNDVLLSWQRVPNASSYTILASSESDTNYVGIETISAAETSYVHINALTSLRQYYVIEAECHPR